MNRNETGRRAGLARGHPVDGRELTEPMLAEPLAEKRPHSALPRNLKRRGYPEDYLTLIAEGKRLIEQQAQLVAAIEEANGTTLRWQVLVAQVVMRDGGEVILDDTPLSRFPDQLELTHDPSLGRTTVRAVFGGDAEGERESGAG